MWSFFYGVVSVILLATLAVAAGLAATSLTMVAGPREP